MKTFDNLIQEVRKSMRPLQIEKSWVLNLQIYK